MFKAVRISILLFVLFFVTVSTWLTQARSTDWNNSLWVKVYPINADGSADSAKYIQELQLRDFEDIEDFLQRETGKYASRLSRPVRIELGQPIDEQPPEMFGDPNGLSVMLWSLKMRWWANSIAGEQDSIEPDVRIFVRYHTPHADLVLENSVGLQKGMVGVVNGFAHRRYRARIPAYARRNGQVQPRRRTACRTGRPRRTGSRAALSAAARRDHGRQDCAGRRRCCHPQEPQVRGYRREDGPRDQPRRLIGDRTAFVGSLAQLRSSHGGQRRAAILV